VGAVAPKPRTGGWPPRPVRFLAAGAAALLLTALLVVVNFPYERVRGRIEQILSARLGAPVELGGVEGRLTPFGPAVLLRDVRTRTRGGSRVELSEVRLRPAWSLAWLRGVPALHLRASSPMGRARGVLRVESEPGFRGEIRDLRLEALATFGGALAELPLDGIADLEGNVRATADGPEGRVRIAARDGSIGVPGIPVALPFRSLEGVVRLGGDRLLEIADALAFDGPMLSGTVTGSVGRAPRLEQARLDLRAELRLREPGLAPALSAAGIRLDREGRGSVRITGTPARVGIR